MKYKFFGKINITVIIIVLILIVSGLFIFGRSSNDLETLTAKKSNFINKISVSGKVVAARSVDLGFDQSGRVSSISTKVGDTTKTGTVIAQIENSTFLADINKKKAALQREQTKLVSLQKGTRPEEIEITKQNYLDSSTSLINAIRSSYLETENALLEKVDTIFNNGNSVNPTLNIYIRDFGLKREIEFERLLVTEKIKSWKNSIDTLNSNQSKVEILKIRDIGIDTINLTKKFLDRILIITAELNYYQSGLYQSDIDAIRSTINSASLQASNAATAEQNAYSTWINSLNKLNLDQSGSTIEDILTQEAEIEVAKADLNSAEALYKKTFITAPFDGIISKLDIKVGEIVSPNSSQITLKSSGIFEIESYIPEINIAKISIGNPANITLDAFGENESFSARIIAIDPAETIKDGVSTYKTTLQFLENDSRIKSGMTANIQVTTEEKQNVISIPQSIIINKNGKKFVTIKKREIINDVEIETGSVSGLGQVEIISGLNDGDIIILPPVSL